MIRRKLIAVLLVLALLLQLLAMGSCAKIKGYVKILDKKEKEITTLETLNVRKNNLTDSGHAAYLEVVVDEAVSIIAELEKCSLKNAKKLLLKNGYSIYTSFDTEIYSSIQDAYTKLQADEPEFACAVTDLDGHLLAAFSAAKTPKNLATKKTAPYSAFKPLSVYAPVIDSEQANWSSLYRDAPVKKVTVKKNETKDWPSNPDGTYSYKDITLFAGVRQSLNTVAVRCLQQYGVQNSIDLLKKNYGIDLSAEENKINVSGEEEVLGNIALGYLTEGVSPVDMAGYYQTFGNGGNYIAPKTITHILNKDGEEIYTAEQERTQVMKETTAFIMNQLLQGVVSPAGTGSKAAIENVAVAGKTGTGEDGNWFVGITPEYSCAVWHGNEYEYNRADEIFGSIVGGFKHTDAAQFNGCSGIRKAVCCADSGQLLGKKCIKMQMGYYESTKLPAVCQKH